MLAYTFCFAARMGYFLYPEPDGNEGHPLQMNSDISFEGTVMPRDDITVIKHELGIPPNVENYAAL